MLDDLKFIHEKDPQDALGVVEKQWQQLEHVFDAQFKSTNEIRNVVLAGMGGSALWAHFCATWPGFNVPFEIVKDYDVPPYVNKNTLFIASSYSGNTEETIAALSSAEKNAAMIVIITSGGKLAQLAKEKEYPLLELPKINKPRYGAFYGFRALVTVLEAFHLTVSPKPLDELDKAASFVCAALSQWKPEVATKDNYAKQLALELVGKSTVIYSGATLAPAAHKWKISLNENAKNVAWEYTFPEFNHNEFTGWTSHPITKPYAIVYLLSSLDHERVKKRFELSDKLLSGRWPSPLRVNIRGDGKLQQLLWAVTLGDFVSIYVALLNGVSPIDVGDKDIIEKFKGELG